MAGSVSFLSAGQFTLLQSHVVRSKGRAPVNVPFVSQHLPSYRRYSNVSMEKAYEAVVTGIMSVRKAATECGVPQANLHEKVTGNVVLGLKSG